MAKYLLNTQGSEPNKNENQKLPLLEILKPTT